MVHDISARVKPPLGEGASIGSTGSFWSSFISVALEDVKSLKLLLVCYMLYTHHCLKVFDIVGPYTVKLISIAVSAGSVKSL